jgi:hypothetical protein
MPSLCFPHCQSAGAALHSVRQLKQPPMRARLASPPSQRAAARREAERSVQPALFRAVFTWSALAPKRERRQMLVRVAALPPSVSCRSQCFATGGSEVSGIIVAMRTSNAPPPNPSFERTRKGRPRCAVPLFFAPRGLPLRSAQVTR